MSSRIKQFKKFAQFYIGARALRLDICALYIIVNKDDILTKEFNCYMGYSFYSITFDFSHL